ncbi:class I SAM-dependent RNA methyltransferase [Sneathiella glossodoripedis]|uniref:class I SAM-dependent RNA methyltransferase n=1 Tax=Sneathiella glossodoripedis TaxID=418853 RepID=UPI000472840F|nr:RsmD family RNA methyltransferase [Sneathiella glossodoripedis]
MTLKLKIEELGAGGDGIAHTDGQDYYVPFSAPGDQLLATPLKKQGSGYLAEISELQEPSNVRSAPVCRHYGTCGGCNLQHLSDNFLASWKGEAISRALEKVGISNSVITPTLTSPEKSRRRVEFMASRRKKGVMIGYHVRKSHQVFDVGECHVITPALKKLIQPMRLLLGNILPRNSKARLTLTECLSGIDLKIACALSPDLEMRELLANFANDHALSRITWHDTDTKLEEVICALKPSQIALGPYNVPINAGGFLQATEHAQNCLIDLTLRNLTDHSTVLDLFAGCGSFSIPAAQKAKSVVAVEGDPDLVGSLTRGANQHMLPITAIERDLFRDPYRAEELDDFDCVIIDPPRAGAKAQVGELAVSNISKIIFISCNPASFARDARTLIDAGYEMGEITPVDQFRWSSHVELFTTFSKG